MASENDKPIEKEEGTNSPSSVLPDELSEADVEKVGGGVAGPHNYERIGGPDGQS
jgi:hypothetical protein